jgi:hypothetical protein
MSTNASALAERRARLVEYAGEAVVRDLENDIKLLTDKLHGEFSESQYLTNWGLELLKESQKVLWDGDTARFGDAWANIERLRARLELAERSTIAAKKYAIPLMVWGGLWSALVVPALWFYNIFNPRVVGSWVMQDLICAAVFGALGGAVSIFYNLMRQIWMREYDPQSNLMYVAAPLLGALFGVLTLVLVSAGFFLAISETTGIGVNNATPPSFTMFTLAFLVGFRSELFYQIIDRIVGVLAPKPEKKKPAATDAASVANAAEG